MSEILLPATHMSEQLLKLRLPLGQVYVDTVTCDFNAGPEPPGVRTDILPLYYSRAYPEHYYVHKINVDVEPLIDFDFSSLP